MYKLLTTKGQLFAVVLGVLSVAIGLGSIVSGINSNYSMSDNLIEILKTDETANFDFFNPALYIVVALIAIATILAFLSIISGLISDFKGSSKFILGLVVLAILFFFLYSGADEAGSEKLVYLTEKFDVPGNVSKLIEGGIKTTVFAIVIAAVAAAVMEIINFFK